MQNKLLEKLMLLIFFWVTSNYADTYESAITNHEDFIPSQSSQWIEPYDPMYLPFGVCQNMTDIKIVRVREKVKYYWTGKKDANSYIHHYHNLVSVVEVTYQGKCANKLIYEGIEFLFSDNHDLDETFASKEEKDEFCSHAHEYVEKPIDYISEDGTYKDKIYPEFSTYTKFDKAIVAQKWVDKKVDYPEWKYMGGPSKLSRPVLFIHGLNDDFLTWGVESVVEKNEKGTNKSDDEFQKGHVVKYKKGSAPDVLARFLNVDNTKEHINHNGIYFFQAPGSVVQGEWRDAKPHWNGINGKDSQSSKLYRRIEEILDDFYPDYIKWREHPELKIDIVAHSQGGLVVREMLRGLREENVSSGPDNPANHIGRLVTVDTPHLGAATASESAADILKYPGLGVVIDDLNAYASGDPIKHPLANINVEIDYLNPMLPLITGAAAGAVGGSLGVLGLAIPVVAGAPITNTAAWTALIVGGTTAGIVVSTASVAEYNVYAVGPYLGPYKIRFNVDPLGPSVDFDLPWSVTLDPIEESRDKAIKVRELGDYLYDKDKFIMDLNYGSNGESYPRLPNGERLEILPLYSGDVSMVVVELLKKMDENLKIKCPEVSEEDRLACIAFDSYIQRKADSLSLVYTGETIDMEIDANDSLLTILDNIRETWLTNSDLIVETESQQYQDINIGVSHNQIRELKKARPFLIHDALAPWETVVHMGGIPGGVASSRQGLDIVCALDPYCDALLTEQSGGKMIYLNDGRVSMTGNFDVAPIYLNEGKQGIGVSDGKNVLEAVYEPGIGSYVNYTDNDGNVKQDIVVPAEIATNPRVQRDGQNISIRFENYSGKIFTKNYTISDLSENVTLSILGTDGGQLPSVMAGVGTASDPSSQVPPSSPDAWETGKSIFVMHREIRGDYEMNISRPRILIANLSDKDIQGFKVAYYFTADPARFPRVKVDYPNIPVTLENLGGDQWRFVLDASDSVLKAKSVFPSLDGWQIRLYYDDWTDFKYLDDWSANYNLGVPQMNKNIVVYDSKDHIMWGREPEPYRSVDNDIIQSPKGIISWVDAAPWEKNMFKPQVTVKNTGSVVLKDYHAKFWFRVPQEKELYIPPYDWYTPVSRPSFRNIGENVWELDLYFDRYRLYPEESVVEGNIGIRLDDWSAFDKTVCGIALIDLEGNVIYGKIPTVSECLSYDPPGLLETQYAWRY